MNTRVIDPAFRAEVVGHIAGNLLLENSESPLILAIAGPPGSGKTFQLEAMLGELGIQATVISPGELESENAGQPGQLLRRQYLEASNALASRIPAALIINDADAVLGNWGEMVQYTVNTQVVISQLMAFCDYPNQVAGHQTRRVPIFLTGNNLSLLYAPLMRPGRTRTFVWDPDVATLLPIIESLFPSVPKMALRDAVHQHPTQPIAFWAAVRAAIWQQRMRGWLDGMGPESVRTMLRTGQTARFESESISVTELRQTALELAKDRGRRESFLAPQI